MEARIAAVGAREQNVVEVETAGGWKQEGMDGGTVGAVLGEGEGWTGVAVLSLVDVPVGEGLTGVAPAGVVVEVFQLQV